MAIIVPALKLPEASLNTIVFGVFDDVADVFESMGPVILMAVTAPSAINPVVIFNGVISFVTINELVIIPEAPECNIPVERLEIVNVPLELILITNIALVEKFNDPVLNDKPVLLSPTCKLGEFADPEGRPSAPVIVAPDNNTSKVACPVTVPATFPVTSPIRFEVITFAEKLLEPSRTTILFGNELDDISARLEFNIVAGVISAFTINDVVNVPDASLCTIPTEFKFGIATTPLVPIFRRDSPFVENSKLPRFDDNPTSVVPIANPGKLVDPE